MPRIPKGRRQRIPSGRVGGVPTPMDIADTGAGIEARGLGALGRGVGDLGQALFKIEEAEGISQASTAKGQAEAEMRLLEGRLRTNNDPTTYQAELEKSLETISGFRPKNPLGVKRFDDYLEQAVPGWESGVSVLQIRKKQALIEGAYISDRSQAIINGDLAEANRLTIEARDQTGAITPQQAAKDLASAPSLIVRSRVTSLLNDANRLSVAGEWGKANIAIEQAQAILDTVTDLDSETERLLRGRIATMRKATETQEQIEEKMRDDEISDGFLGLLINKLDPTEPQLTFDMIETSDLSVDAKGKWFGKLRVFDNYSEGELKEAFTDKGEVLADIYNKIDKGILKDELDTMVGNGLSPTTSQRIKKEIRAPYEKDTEQLFKRIFGWTPELGFKDDFAGFLYEKSLREWQAEIKTQDATGDKIIEIGRSVVRPYFLEHLQRTMVSGEDITRMMELALGEETEKLEPPKPIEAEEPRREPGEPLTSTDFISEVTRLKGIDREKAKEYYDTWIEKFKKKE